MRKLMLSISSFAVLLAANPTTGQTPQKDILLKHWKTSGEFTLAVAAAMPADSYTFRPTPEEMSFGELMAHIAGPARNACTNASGLTPPPLSPEIEAWTKDTVKIEVSKDAATQFLKDTFDFCAKAITEMPGASADKIVGPPNRNLTGTEWLWSYFTHTAHHRGQAEVYLRLKAIKPPAYTF
jgi:uncharacterized damage-inducible protein DinB